MHHIKEKGKQPKDEIRRKMKNKRKRKTNEEINKRKGTYNRKRKWKK